MRPFFAVLALTFTCSVLALPVGLCGGLLRTPCSDGFFCDKPMLTCGQRLRLGMCQPQPEVCTFQYEPVCGCDGITYSNDCERMAAGVALADEGPCTVGDSPTKDVNNADDGDAPEVESCDGLFSSTCSEGFFCEKPPLACGHALRLGVCESKPQICTVQYEPMCGCNGETYSNDCKRKAAGVGLAHEGACEPDRAHSLQDAMILDAVEKRDGDALTGTGGVRVESDWTPEAEKSNGDPLEKGEGEEGEGVAGEEGNDEEGEEGEGEAGGSHYEQGSDEMGHGRETTTGSPPVNYVASSPSPTAPSPSLSPTPTP